jgi:hypothetical protein
MVDMILRSDFMEFLFIKNVGYNALDSDRVFADIWILTEGMGSDKIQ